MNESKVTPVEAQAVPDQPVAWMSEDGRTISDKQKAALIVDGGASATTMRAFSIPLFTRPTPAAADLREALERVCSHKPRTPAQIDADWNFARAALAASPAAAADLHQQPRSDHLAAPRAAQDFRAASALSEVVPSADVLLDAARYRWLRGKTDVGLKDIGSLSPSFRLPPVIPARGTNLMKGSVAQHLDAAIDAALNDTEAAAVPVAQLKDGT